MEIVCLVADILASNELGTSVPRESIMVAIAKPVPTDIIEAMEQGCMTRDQVQRLAVIEAQKLGLDFDDAVRLAHENRLPKNALGTDLLFLIQILKL